MSELKRVAKNLATTLVFLGLLLGLVVGGVWWTNPFPPKVLRLAVGSAGGPTHKIFGERYKEECRHFGMEVQLVPTRGTIDSLRKLQEGQVDGAFTHALLPDIRKREAKVLSGPQTLYSMGTLSVQPLWIFYRAETARVFNARHHPDRRPSDELVEIEDFKGWRFNVGSENGATREALLNVLSMGGVVLEDLKYQEKSPPEAIDNLLKGKVDAIGFASMAEYGSVQELLAKEGVRLFNFSLAEAYAKINPQLREVTLPQGIFDLRKNKPSQDVNLLAITGSLVVREDLHPALQDLLAMVALRVHNGPGWVQRRGEYPKVEVEEGFKLNARAREIYRDGPPRLVHSIPFVWANLIDRTWLLVLSVVIVLMPLVRILPRIFVVQEHLRIFWNYHKLKRLSASFHAHRVPPEVLLPQVKALDVCVAQMEMPTWNRAALYSLRSHIGVVQKDIQVAVDRAAAANKGA